MRAIFERGVFSRLALLSAILAALPFVLYALARITGILPSEEQWYSNGTNHGPWRWSLQGFTIGYPLGLLAVASLVITPIECIRARSGRPLLWGAALIFFAIGVGYAQLRLLVWTID